MNDYDFYLRHASVRGGAWVGFALGRQGASGVQGLGARPHLRLRPWILNPANPNDPAQGSWGVWQWQLSVLMVDGFVGLAATPPADARTAADMRADLLAYLDLPILELMDVDSAIYTVRVTGYNEQNIEPYDAAHQYGGWLARLDLCFNTP